MKENEFIALIGMPGSGKTTLGKMAAKRLGWPFIDADEYIEEMAGLSIHALYREGEEIFRRTETEAYRRLGDIKKTVLACGGGFVLKKENVELLKKHGRLVFIDRPIDQIARDIDPSRPILKDGLERIYAERYPLYLRCADYQIPNTGNPEEAIEVLMRYLTGAEDTKN